MKSYSKFFSLLFLLSISFFVTFENVYASDTISISDNANSSNIDFIPFENGISPRYYAQNIFDDLDSFSYYSQYIFGDSGGFSSIEAEEALNTLFSSVISLYEENYAVDYPYFNIEIIPSLWDDANDYHGWTSEAIMELNVNLYAYKTIPTFSTIYEMPATKEIVIGAEYDMLTDTFTPAEINNYYSATYGRLFTIALNDKMYNTYNPFIYAYSNFDLVFDLTDTYTVSKLGITYSNGDIISPLFDNLDDYLSSKWVEINLNDYNFVGLSLKNYNVSPFKTNFWIKGEFCPTVVYNYGTTPRDEVLTEVTDICSPYQEEYTSINFYVTELDIQNNAVYYIKARDTTKENLLKVNSNIFDISLIDEEDKDNPYMYINGEYRPVLPFDDLPSNSITNTDEEKWPGASDDFTFSDIFTSPLEVIKDVWGAISSVFDLIKEFIYLLPQELSIFLFMSFTLAIILGLIKIIL